VTLRIEHPDVAVALRPLLDKLPIDRAMTQLVVTRGADTELVGVVEKIIANPAIASHPALVAGLWLYLDELDRSHTVSQGMKDATGSFWHGIMHRREGDFGNSHYWFRSAGRHPAMDEIDDYDGHAFIDEVETAHRRGEAPDELIDRQRREWAGLFNWCAGRA